jgi:catechol 2,3-dioxygenase-like lactoylglutathione lyase family enzyme
MTARCALLALGKFMALEITELNHVNVTVPRSLEAAAKHFYGTVLGLEELEKPGESKKRGGAWYKIGPVQLHLSIEDGAEGHAVSKRHVCYIVRDAEQAESELRSAGVEIIPDDKPIEGWKRFYVRDPGGNRIEMAQKA